MKNPTPADVGYMIGTAHGKQIWATVEDSILVLGPPRSGKGIHLVTNAILDAPGPVIATSTRPDALAVTLRQRERRGPVAVFDPQRLAPGLPTGLRWSPIRGCHDPLTAMIRATALAASTSYSDVSSGDYWKAKTVSALQSLLHAAALDGREADVLYRWALNPASAADAVRILQSNTQAATGWADALDASLTADPRTRDAIWHGVSLAFSALADPRILTAVTPRPTEQFDPADFLADGGTLFLLATSTGASSSAGLTAALIEDVTESARRLAATSPAARLDPPLLLALDEVANIAPLPSLPSLMAEGGGTGITCMPVLQSLAQARHRWGEHAAAAIWDAAIVKILLGGSSGSRDLHDLSTLLGERDELVDAVTIDQYGARTIQRSPRRVPILSVDQLRRLPFGTDLVLLRTTRPIISTLRPWSARPDSKQLHTDRTEIEEALRSVS